MATFARSFLSRFGIKTEQPECFRCDNHSVGILKQLQARLDLCDVVLIVGDSGKRISAHRLILIACSDYFSALLSESQEREITLNEVDGDALEKLVNFCYTGSLQLRGDTVAALLITANHLHLKKVVEGGCEFLQRHLQPSNCLAVVFFAEQLNLEALLHNAKKFICEHFQEVSNYPEFFLLTARQMSEFIANDDLNVPSEEFVFRILMKWIEYEPENRMKHFSELLSLVRLPLLPPTFLAEKVEPLCNTVESQKLVLSALKSHLLLTSNSTQPRNYQSKSVANKLLAIQPKDYQSKSFQKQLLAIYSREDFYRRKFKIEIAGYNLLTNEWTISKIPITFRRWFAAVLVDDNLIVVGGSVKNSLLNTVTSFNLQTMASAEMSPLKTRRDSHCVAILNGSIYAIGGNDGKQALNSVERWDPTSGTWSSVAPMKNARFRPEVAVMNGHLYVCGGYNTMHVFVTTMECYDPVEDTWRCTAPMKVGRHSHCLTAHKGYLFAIGGMNGSQDECSPIERYDPRTETWTTIPCSPAIYGHTRCTSLGPDLFIINKSGYTINSYKISSAGSCEYIKLQTLPKAYPELEKNDSRCVELFTIPYELCPSGN